MATTNDQDTVPLPFLSIYQQLIQHTDAFCQSYLTDEYAVLCRKLAVAVCRERLPSLTKGSVQSWACSIVYAIGDHNGLFDPARTPHLYRRTLCELFGGAHYRVVRRNVKLIVELLDILAFDPEWTLPSRQMENPLMSLILVNGELVDAGDVPPEVLEAALRDASPPPRRPPAGEQGAAADASERGENQR